MVAPQDRRSLNEPRREVTRDHVIAHARRHRDLLRAVSVLLLIVGKWRAEVSSTELTSDRSRVTLMLVCLSVTSDLFDLLVVVVVGTDLHISWYYTSHPPPLFNFPI